MDKQSQKEEERIKRVKNPAKGTVRSREDGEKEKEEVLCGAKEHSLVGNTGGGWTVGLDDLGGLCQPW